MASVGSALSIGELAAATGVAPGTLRMWEARHGFPQPTRRGGGDRRYGAEDVARIVRVVRERERGLSLAAAIERVRNWSPSAPPSLFQALRDWQPGLVTHRLSVPGMLALSRAIEDECLARAARPILVASFQHERAYRRVEARWAELARTAALAFVLADFPRRRAPRNRPIEVPLDARAPVAREWAIVCVDERCTACLAGWEQPVEDGPRAFEAIWTTEPEAVIATLRRAIAVAGDHVAGRAGDALERLPLITAGDTLATLSLANRMIGYLAAGRP